MTANFAFAIPAERGASFGRKPAPVPVRKQRRTSAAEHARHFAAFEFAALVYTLRAAKRAADKTRREAVAFHPIHKRNPLLAPLALYSWAYSAVIWAHGLLTARARRKQAERRARVALALGR